MGVVNDVATALGLFSCAFVMIYYMRIITIGVSHGSRFSFCHSFDNGKITYTRALNSCYNLICE